VEDVSKFIAIWYILWSFGISYGRSVYFGYILEGLAMEFYGRLVYIMIKGRSVYFGYILEGLAMEDVGPLYARVVYFTAVWYIL
jgi:hypothetical protein